MWNRLKKERICIQQHNESDCGAASLCAIAAWHGLFLPLSKVKSVCNCTKDGITIKGILEGAHSLGLNGQALKSPQKRIEALEEIHMPFIAHLNKEDGLLHFVVVVKTLSNRVEIMDPAIGEIVSYPINRFRGEWSGYIILLTPNEKFKPGDTRTPFRKRLKTIVANNKKWLIAPMILSFALILLGTANAFILQRLIDVTIPYGRKDEIVTIAVILLVIIVSTAIMEQYRGMSLIKGGLNIDRKLIGSYIEKVFSLHPTIFSQYTPADFNSRIGDAYNIRVFISEGLVALPLCCATLLVVFILMVLTNCRLAVLTLLFFPLYAVICIVSVNLNRKHDKNLALLNAHFESSMLHGMDALITIKHLGAERAFTKRVIQRYRLFQEELLKAGRCATVVDTAGGGISAMLFASTLTIGGFLVIGGELTVGEIVSFYTLCSLFTSPLDGIAQMAKHFSKASVSIERLFEILDMGHTEEPAKKSTCNQTEIGGDIIFENISFAYPGRELLFDKFSTHIKAHAITAIYGKNGSGKSTLAAMLMRDIEPLCGKILIGGRYMEEIPADKWRRVISIIPQKPFIFNDTLLANITSLEENPDMTLVSKACVEAGLAEFIKRLPNGICTNIGGGVGLSGGEMQKISIARALYRDSQIYIFDEATSNMDELGENSIIGVMVRLRKMGKSVIVISHNNKVMRIADELIDLG